MNALRASLAGLLVATAPLLQGCCCCSGCPDLGGGGLGDAVADRVAEESVEAITGVEVEEHDDGGTVSLSSDEGSMTLTAGDTEYPADLPLPPYPGATVEGGMTMSSRPQSATTAALRTDDSLEDVSAWYAEQLGPDADRVQVSTGDGDAHTYTRPLDDGRQVVVTITDDGSERMIAVMAGSQ